MENVMGYVLLIMAISVIVEIISIPLWWSKFKPSAKAVLSIAVPIQFLATALLILNNWGIFAWGRAGAFESADRFLTAMKQGKYLEATQYMKPCVREVVGIDELGEPEETRPIDWQWTDYEGNFSFASTIGTAKFIDGTELRIELELEWNGYKWEVVGVTFGEPCKDSLIQFSWSCKNIFDFGK